jgi:predicted amidohydrolase
MFIATLTVMAQNVKAQALIGVEIFNGKSDDLKSMTIIIEDGKIKDIFKTGSKIISDSINKIDLTGYYVIPGLIDTHVHLGMKGISKSTDASRKEFRKWIYSGVTTVRDMGGDARVLALENQLIKDDKQPGPDIYFSATVGSSDMIAKDLRLKRVTQGLGIDKAGYVIEAKKNMDIKQSVIKAVQSRVTGLKFYAGINADLIKALTMEAHNQGLKSWAHFTVFPDRPIEVVKAGVDVVSHVWGAFWQDTDVDPSDRIPFTHTDFKNARSAVFPEDMSVLNTDSPELQLLFNEMQKRGVIWDITYVVPNPKVQKIYKKYALAASQAGVEFSTGTDYFNDITESYPSLFKEIESLVTDGILNSRQVLLSATLNGAKAIGIEKTHGTIEEGKIANLVVLKKNPIENITNIREIELTMKNGIIYNRINYN